MSRGVRRALFTVAYYWNNQRQIASWVGLLTVPEKCFCKTALSTYLYSRLPLLLIQSTSPSSILVVCFIPLSCLVAQQTDVSDLMSPSQWKKISKSPPGARPLVFTYPSRSTSGDAGNRPSVLVIRQLCSVGGYCDLNITCLIFIMSADQGVL